MQDWDDNALLREFVERGSEESFAALVARHVSKVYSVALRQTGNPHHAEEITQTVFVLLARKARSFGKGVVLSGWLYQTARLTAITFIRSEIRRTHREHEAQMQNQINEKESEVWTQVAPLLNTAMGKLSDTDRHAVVLRFFDNKSMKEVGAALGASEAAAKMRLNRATEKLRQFFAKRGVVVSSSVLSSAISAHSVQTAPVLLTKTVTAVVMAKGAAASSSTTGLMKAALKLSAWTNAKMAMIVGVAVLAVGASATLVMQSQAKPGTTIPHSDWVYSGYADPVAAVKTLAWAVSRNDGKAIFASMSPACQEELQQLAASAKPPTSVEAFITTVWNGHSKRLSAYHILSSEDLAENDVLMHITGTVQGETGEEWLELRKTGDEWKFDDFDAKSQVNGRTKMPPPHPEYGGVGLTFLRDTEAKSVRIIHVLTNSPSAQAGLTAGLIVTKINGESTGGKTAAECLFLTRGLVGRSVRLELVNPARDATNRVELKRQRWTP